MQYQDLTRAALASATTLVGAAAAAGARAADKAALDKSFDALKTFAWGTDRNVLKGIDEAVPATHGDTAALRGIGNAAPGGAEERRPACSQGFRVP